MITPLSTFGTRPCWHKHCIDAYGKVRKLQSAFRAAHNTLMALPATAGVSMVTKAKKKQTFSKALESDKLQTRLKSSYKELDELACKLADFRS